jgi:thiol-disulfide isomerase/thioredoxin
MSIRSIVGLALIVPAAIVIFFVLTASGPGHGQMGPKQAEASCTKAAPDCLPQMTFMDSNHEVYPPESLKGKVVVVNFWATWCPPCKREIPAFNRVYEEYKDKGVVFFGVLQEDVGPNEILNFASDHEMTYPIIPMDDSQGVELSRHFGLAANLPTTFIYDKTGARRKNQVGPLDDRDYFERAIGRICADFVERWPVAPTITPEDIELVDGHVGLGYAKSRPEDLATLRDLARRDGIVLDPVYTGKAFHGVVTELARDRARFGERLVFLHTGGIFGLFGDTAAELAAVL